MPQMADVTVKASNGTTDVIFKAQAPSSGDNGPAVWRVDAASTRPGFRPTAQMRTGFNGPRTARNARITFSFPVVEQVAGIDTIVARVPVELQTTLPTGVSETALLEAVAQAGNFLVSTLIRDSLKAGYAPS